METPHTPTWCEAVDKALGALSQDFSCLAVPNFLVTGFYGTKSNPERSDFANSCFAGSIESADRLKMSVRPTGDLRFTMGSEREVTAQGGLDLRFLGPWAPELRVARGEQTKVSVTVELADPEIRVLSSVAEILGQEYARANADSPEQRSLEVCLDSLCAKEAGTEELVYTAKVLAAVPVITIASGSEQNTSGAVSVLGDLTRFELSEQSGADHGFELRAKEKLNVAARLEPAAPALERASTCKILQNSRAHRTVANDLRELGLQVVAERDLASLPGEAGELRKRIDGSSDAFSTHEHRDLLRCLEALEAASAELASSKPTRKLCTARDLLEEVLTADGEDNRLHELLTEVAEPLHRELTKVANEHALPCADPAFYRDADGDGFGDPKAMRRSPRQPNGFVANSLDCFDANRQARPGQTKYFSQTRGDGSFDYDCDGKETREHKAVTGGCKSITRFTIPIHCWAEAGWRDKAPSCGQEGRWFAACSESLLSCDPAPDQVKRQLCR